MDTKIKTVIGAIPDDIVPNRFSIFVPISLGNKWFTKEHIKQYILWALKYSKDDIIIVIADKLHQINVEVKDHYAPHKAKRKVERISLKIEAEIRQIINNLDEKEQLRTTLLRWGDIDQDSKYLAIRQAIYSEFDKNKDFRETIMNIVNDSIKKIKNRTFSKEEVLKLSQYALNELPIFLYGAEHNKKRYNLHPYPVFTKICELVDRIQNGDFNDFYNKIGRPRAVIVELEVL